ISLAIDLAFSVIFLDSSFEISVRSFSNSNRDFSVFTSHDSCSHLVFSNSCNSFQIIMIFRLLSVDLMHTAFHRFSRLSIPFFIASMLKEAFHVSHLADITAFSLNSDLEMVVIFELFIDVFLCEFLNNDSFGIELLGNRSITIFLLSHGQNEILLFRQKFSMNLTEIPMLCLPISHLVRSEMLSEKDIRMSLPPMYHHFLSEIVYWYAVWQHRNSMDCLNADSSSDLSLLGTVISMVLCFLFLFCRFDTLLSYSAIISLLKSSAIVVSCEVSVVSLLTDATLSSVSLADSSIVA
ncbi:hypothetical protein ALC57_14312, partial [Trachymyrmex cornetzi]